MVFNPKTEPGRLILDESAQNGGRSVAVNGKVYCYNCSKKGHFGHVSKLNNLSALLYSEFMNQIVNLKLGSFRVNSTSVWT